MKAMMRYAVLALVFGSVAFVRPMPVATQADTDSDAPLECRTALSNFSAADDADEADDSMLTQLRAKCEMRGGAPTLEQKPLVNAAVEHERQVNAALLPGGTAPAGTPVWRSLGPTRNNWWTNGPSVHVSETNSGRTRQIVQHPSNPDVVYTLTSGGGLWRTDNFSLPKPDWRPLASCA